MLKAGETDAAAASAKAAEELEKAKKEDMEECPHCEKMIPKGSEKCKFCKKSIKEEEEEEKSLDNVDIETMLMKAMGDEASLLRANEVFAELFDITRDALKSADQRGADAVEKVEALGKKLDVTMKAVSAIAKSLDEVQTLIKTATASPGTGKILGTILRAGLNKAAESQGDGTTTVEPKKEQFLKAIQTHVITERQYAQWNRGAADAITEDVMKKVAAL